MQEMPELRTVMAGFYKALSSGDAATIDGLICDHAGVLGIGTDPDEWWDGHGTLLDKMKTQMNEMGGVKIVGSDPRAYSEGTVGWVADRPRFKLDDGTESPFRLTAIFHKEKDGWKVVQFHTSVGVPNEELIGKELTV
jgi:ketosteroid isomerase-like protein